MGFTKYFAMYVWKKLFFYKLNHQRLKKMNQRAILPLFCRNSYLPRYFTDAFVYIHNGRFFIRMQLNRMQIGYKVGQFAYTRKLFYYPMRKKIKPRK